MSTTDLVKPYQQLRDATLGRDRGLREKVMSLEEAAKLVKDGEHVGIGGCTLSRTPMAMIWQLIRARKKNLSCSRCIISTDGDLLNGLPNARTYSLIGAPSDASIHPDTGVFT